MSSEKDESNAITLDNNYLEELNEIIPENENGYTRAKIYQIEVLKSRISFVLCTVIFLSIYLGISYKITAKEATNLTLCPYDEVYTAAEVFFYSNIFAMGVVLMLLIYLFLQYAGLKEIQENGKPFQNATSICLFRGLLIVYIFVIGISIFALASGEECLDEQSADSVINFIIVAVAIGLLCYMMMLLACFGVEMLKAEKSH